LIPLRVVVAETHTFEVPRLFRHLDVPDGAGPATTFAIFALIVSTAAVVVIAKLRCGQRLWSATGMELGAAILLVAMIVSTWRAGQKHLAIIGSLDMLGLIVFAATLRRLLTQPWHVRLTLCVILTAGAMNIVKCAYQKWIETPDTIRYFEENRAELMPRQSDGNSAEAGFLHDYEQRLRSGSVSGYFAHPNVLASYLILIVMTAIAMLLSRLKVRPGWTLIAPAIIAAGGLAALQAAQSKGAAAALAIALGLLLLGTILRGAIIARPRTTVIAVLLGGVLAAAALAATLSTRPDALGRSMLFRSLYWQGAWNMLLDRGPWGIGANNFGRLFTAYKDVSCPEDVEDPHSWVVKTTLEWGVLGLVGFVTILVGAAWHMTRRRESLHNGPSPGGSIILWTGGIGAIVFTWWACIVSGATEEYALLVLHIPALTWIVMMITLSLEGPTRQFAADPPKPMLIPLCAGLLGFLLHAGIDLAMFNGGAATTFFAIAAVVMAIARPPESDAKIESASQGKRPRTNAAIAIAAFATTFVLTITVVLVIPSAKASSNLRIARLQPDAPTWDIYLNSPGHAAYSAATDAYQLDATAADELLEELTRRVATIDHVHTALPLVDVMRARDPFNAAAWQHLATIRFQRFVIGRDTADLSASIDATKKAVEAYPTSPNKRLTLAELYEKAAATGDADARRKAADELEKALSLDDERIYVSKPNHFPEEMRASIRRRIDTLRGD
jgi:O-antigen ligase